LPFESHLQRIISRNITAALADYDNNATLTWIGGGPRELGGGTFQNKSNIKALYNGLFTQLLGMSITNVKVATAVGDRASVDASFYLNGRLSGGCGNFSGTVRSSVSFVLLANKWWISKEVWSFGYPFSPGICG
jgi:hypothetical protein